MQNLNKSAESKGVVLFAFNTETVDYVKIADNASRLVEKYLQLPVTLITDASSVPKYKYDNIIIVEKQDGTFRTDDPSKKWRNFGRYLAYELSPYQDTILIDSDYLVLDNGLNRLFDTEFDYKLMHHNKNYTGPVYEMMGNVSLPYIWATVVLFKKTLKTKLFFELIGKIQRNYGYYRSLYNIRESNYRNDYAFAIANNIINGYNLNESQGIPWSMFTVDEKIERIMLTDTQLRIYHSNNAVVLPYQNTHIMDKEYLQSRDFEQVVEAICEPT